MGRDLTRTMATTAEELVRDDSGPGVKNENGKRAY
jgi:hypothetical protein